MLEEDRTLDRHKLLAQKPDHSMLLQLSNEVNVCWEYMSGFAALKVGGVGACMSIQHICAPNSDPQYTSPTCTQQDSLALLDMVHDKQIMNVCSRVAIAMHLGHTWSGLRLTQPHSEGGAMLTPGLLRMDAQGGWKQPCFQPSLVP